MKTNTFFRIIILFYFIVFSFGSCKNNNLEEEIFKTTYDNFNGKYKIIRCLSDKAVDINLDGLTSN